MKDNNPIKVICILGPTASGKTDLGIKLAKLYDGEIVSADSMQIYKGMNIATAKPGKDEMSGIKHHLIDFLEPERGFSVADFVKLAQKAILDIHSRGKLPLIVGGTGLYADSLINNISFNEYSADASPELRRKLTDALNEKGVDFLLEYLGSFDAESAKRLAEEKNPRRIIRAIEVYETTGRTLSQIRLMSKTQTSPYTALKIALGCRDRQKLYDRINSRVDLMLQNGLLDEARTVYENSASMQTGAQAIGCKEYFPYFKGEQTLDECTEKLKRETRRYAKRQLTWFRRDSSIHWLYIDDYEDSQQLCDEAVRLINNLGLLVTKKDK